VFTLAYKYRETGEVKEQRLSGLFVQIVLLPNSNFQNGVFMGSRKVVVYIGRLFRLGIVKHGVFYTLA